MSLLQSCGCVKEAQLYACGCRMTTTSYCDKAEAIMSGVYAEGRHEGMHLGQLLPTEVEHYHNYLCVHCKANTLQIHDGHSSQNSKLTNADLADFNAYPSLNPSKATMSNTVTDEIAAAGTQSTRELSVSFDASSHSIKINNPEQSWVAACTNQQLQNIPQQNQKQYRDDLPLIRNPVSTDHQKRSYRRPVLYQPRVEWQTPTIREPTHSHLEPFPEYIEYSRPKLLTLENNSLPGRIGDTYTNTGKHLTFQLPIRTLPAIQTTN